MKLQQKTEFHREWASFLATGCLKGVPDAIGLSWLRCRDLEIDPHRENPSLSKDQVAIERLKEEKSDLHELLESHYDEIEEKFDSIPILVAYMDPEGYILSMRGHDETLRMFERSGLLVGSNISEKDIGTTAPGLSMIEQRPIKVHAERHYCSLFHWASCFSVPIWDQDKNSLGYLDFTSPFEFGKRLDNMIPYFLSIAKSLQFEFFLKKRLELIELHNSYFRSTFDYADKALIMVNRSGEIIDLNNAAQRLFRVSPAMAERKNVGELLNIDLPMGSTSSRGETRLLRIAFPGDDSSAPFFMESIPIVNQSGDEIAFLLRLEKGKITNILPSRSAGPSYSSFANIIGESRILRDVMDSARRAAGTSSNVLIEGETGTGKELFAQAIHSESAYCSGPLVALNCCAIPNELIESELFGYEKGAYTGARKEGNAGKFEQADGGSIFFDEVHKMNKSAQMKLLRVLEDRQVTRIGAKNSIPLDLRIIAASSKDLEKEVERGGFIEPLFFRLNVVRLRIPPLRERKDDIPVLVKYFVDEMNKKFKRNVVGLDPEVEEHFLRYSWPGNVRELKNFIECAFNFCDGNTISIDHFKGKLMTDSGCCLERGQGIEGVTKQLMVESLERYGNVKEAARALGISVSTFYRKMKKFGMSK